MKKIIFLFTAPLFLLTGCSTMDAVTGEKTRNFYSMQEDINLGTEVMQSTVNEMRGQGVPLDQDKVRVAQLKEMVRRISAVSDLPDLPYEVVLIHTNIVNAMAAPGGKIMVFEGLWNPQNGLVRDDDELAAVLAHEIAHVTCRHSTEAMTSQMIPNLLFAGGSAVAKAKGLDNIATVFDGTFLLYNGILVPFYSRADEIEADSVGMMYMAKAGYDPRAAPRIWERSAKQSGAGAGVMSIFSTHPADSVRMQNLNSKLPAALAVYESGKK